MLPVKSYLRTAEDEAFDAALPGAAGGFVTALLILFASVIVLAFFTEALSERRHTGWAGAGEVLWRSCVAVWGLVELVVAWLLVVAGLGLVLFVLAFLLYALYSGITGRLL